MLKDELKIILQGKGKSKQEKKYLAIEYEELRQENNELKKEFKKARRSKDFQAMAEINSKLNVELETELRQEVNSTVEIKFRNTSLELDREHLKGMSNPDKYINKLYFNKTVKQIDSLIASGKVKEAKGLIELVEKSDELATDKAKEKDIKNKVEKLKEKLVDESDYDYEDLYDDGGDGDEDTYSVVFTGGGSSISVTVI